MRGLSVFNVPCQLGAAEVGQADESLPAEGHSHAQGNAPLEVMAAQDKVDRPLGQGRQRLQDGTTDVALGDVAGQDECVGLLLDNGIFR